MSSDRSLLIMTSDWAYSNQLGYYIKGKYPADFQRNINFYRAPDRTLVRTSQNLYPPRRLIDSPFQQANEALKGAEKGERTHPQVFGANTTHQQISKE